VLILALVYRLLVVLLAAAEGVEWLVEVDAGRWRDGSNEAQD
jgi:hypothetical protein